MGMPLGLEGGPAPTALDETLFRLRPSLDFTRLLICRLFDAKLAGGIIESREDTQMPDVLNVIQPYWHANAWVFDDASRGLDKEPLQGCFEAELREIMALARLVGGGVTKMIAYLVKDIPDAHEGFILLVSSQPFAGYQVELSRVAEEDGGCLYRAKKPCAEAWLSPALFMYFETTPELLYMKAEPQRAGFAKSSTSLLT
jgi:hypothetical protein